MISTVKLLLRRQPRSGQTCLRCFIEEPLSFSRPAAATLPAMCFWYEVSRCVCVCVTQLHDSRHFSVCVTTVANVALLLHILLQTVCCQLYRRLFCCLGPKWTANSAEVHSQKTLQAAPRNKSWLLIDMSWVSGSFLIKLSYSYLYFTISHVIETPHHKICPWRFRKSLTLEIIHTDTKTYWYETSLNR